MYWGFSLKKHEEVYKIPREGLRVTFPKLMEGSGLRDSLKWTLGEG